MTSALSDAERTHIATQWEYELVPLMVLAEVDLAVSVKSRFIRSKPAQHVFRTLARSPLTHLGFYAFEVSAIVVFFLPAPIGRVLGVVGALAGIPGSTLILGSFRYELVIVLLKTFDTWFFVLIVSVMCTLGSVLLHDARSLLAMLSWFAYMPNVLLDASIYNMRTIWLGNVVAAVSYTVIGVAVSVHAVGQLFLCNVIEANGRVLPATAVVRDCLASMVVLVIRNLVRKYHSVRQADQPALGARVTCVGLRCRLQLRPCIPSHVIVKASPNESPVATKSKLEYAPTIKGLLDIRHTLVQTPWLFRVEQALSRWQKHLIKGLALASVVISIAVGFIELLTPLRTVHIDNSPLTALAAVATAITILSVGSCVALMQRQLLREIVTSFDFLFFAAQITVVDLALADLLYWKPTIVLALVSEWLWTMWILSWDAITPYTRRRLGVTPKFAAIIVTTLIVTITLTAVIVFTVLPPLALHDRVIFRLNVLAHSMDFRVLPWYCSGVATIVAGISRLVWRLWQATENELVLLDGPVVYESTRVRRVGHPSVLARARVAPLTHADA